MSNSTASHLSRTFGTDLIMSYALNCLRLVKDSTAERNAVKADDRLTCCDNSVTNWLHKTCLNKTIQPQLNQFLTHIFTLNQGLTLCLIVTRFWPLQEKRFYCGNGPNNIKKHTTLRNNYCSCLIICMTHLHTQLHTDTQCSNYKQVVHTCIHPYVKPHTQSQ